VFRLHWNVKGSKKDREGKISRVFYFFVLFAFFASTLPGAANPDFGNCVLTSDKKGEISALFVFFITFTLLASALLFQLRKSWRIH
jgi:hypothetical protein